jgi:hypothetical protein
MKTSTCLALAAAFLLSGCEGSPIAMERDARRSYVQSTADYRNCLAANPANVNACEAQRRIMEADERAFNNLSTDNRAAMSGGLIERTNTVVVQERR